MDGPDAIERELILPVPRERVWAALTEPLSLSAWFGTQATVDLRPGGAVTFIWDDREQRGAVHQYRGDRSRRAAKALRVPLARARRPARRCAARRSDHAGRVHARRPPRGDTPAAGGVLDSPALPRSPATAIRAAGSASSATWWPISPRRPKSDAARGARRGLRGAGGSYPATGPAPGCRAGPDVGDDARTRDARDPPGDRQAPAGAQPRGPRRGDARVRKCATRSCPSSSARPPSGSPRSARSGTPGSPGCGRTSSTKANSRRGMLGGPCPAQNLPTPPRPGSGRNRVVRLRRVRHRVAHGGVRAAARRRDVSARGRGLGSRWAGLHLVVSSASRRIREGSADQR